MGVVFKDREPKEQKPGERKIGERRKGTDQRNDPRVAWPWAGGKGKQDCFCHPKGDAGGEWKGGGGWGWLLNVALVGRRGKNCKVIPGTRLVMTNKEQKALCGSDFWGRFFPV